MAAFSESLEFDISRALASIDRVEDALNRSTVQFRTGIATAIDDLREVRIEVDTAALSSEINRAVAAADTTATIDADTSTIRPEIEAAVPAEVGVAIDADTTRARAEVRRLESDVQSATGQTQLLRQALATVGTVGALRGLQAIADLGGALQEQLSGSVVVFGDLSGQVQEFADDAPSIGLAADEALRAANNFGLMARSAGLAGAEVAEFATTIVARGADIASLRDLDIGETLQALQSGLAGETEPLRRLGSFLNEARVEAEAFRLGLVDTNGVLDDAAKIQARYSLILQDTAVAQGDFARTSDSLTNSQRILRAEFRDLIAQIGIDLSPAFAGLVSEGRDLLPTIDALAREALPPLLSALTDLAPLLGISLDILIALSPILGVVAGALDAIPGPLLAIGAGAIAIDRAGLALTRFSTRARTSEGALGGLNVAVARLRAGMAGTAGLGAAVGLTAAVVALGVASESGADPIGAAAEGVLKLGDSFTNFIGGRSERAEGFVADLIAGLDTNKLSDASAAVGVLRSELDALDDVEGRGRLFAVGDTNLFLTSGDAERDVRIAKIREEIETIEAQAEAEIDAGLITGRFTQAQVDAAAATAERRNTNSDIITSLGILRREEEREAVAAERTIAAYQPLIGSILGVRDALDQIDVAAPEVSSALLDIRFGAGEGEDAFLRLAQGIDSAGLSGEDLAAVASVLGVGVEDLSDFVDNLTGAVDDFVSRATSGLPTVGTVFEDTLSRAQQAASEAADAIRDADPLGADAIEASARVTADALRDSLNVAAVELGDFRNDLDAITQAGFPELAATLAEQGSEAGNALADELAQALADGNTEILTGLQEAQDNFETQSLETVEFIRNELAPEYLSATGLLASAITETFGENLDFEERVRIAGRLASSELDEQGQAIAAVAAVEGEGAARALGEAMDLEAEVIEAAILAGAAIANDPGGIIEEARALGANIAEGVALGIDENSYLLELSAQQLADVFERSLRRRLKIESPSKVTMELGGQVAEGLALGILGGLTRVGQAAEGLSTAAQPELAASAVRSGAFLAANAPAPPAGGDLSGVVSAIEVLASKVGDTNHVSITGAPDPFATGQEFLRVQRARARRRGR